MGLVEAHRSALARASAARQIRRNHDLEQTPAQ